MTKKMNKWTKALIVFGASGVALTIAERIWVAINPPPYTATIMYVTTIVLYGAAGILGWTLGESWLD